MVVTDVDFFVVVEVFFVSDTVAEVIEVLLVSAVVTVGTVVLSAVVVITVSEVISAAVVVWLTALVSAFSSFAVFAHPDKSAVSNMISIVFLILSAPFILTILPTFAFVKSFRKISAKPTVYTAKSKHFT